MPDPDSIPAPPKNKPSGDKFWETYLSAAGEEDKFLPSSWEANTGGILTFTGLFAATVAAFLVESYKMLSPDSGDQTVLLLQQLLAATVDANAIISQPKPFQVTATAIAVNCLWFSSLLVSLVCALLSTLIQEWARDYRREANRRRTLHESAQNRAFNHIYVRMGIERYRMDQVVYSITALVHLSVLLFAMGLVIFLFPIDHVVAGVVIIVLAMLVLVYAVASVLPLGDPSCPYRTPMTYLCAEIICICMRTSPPIVSDRLKRVPLFGKSVQEMTARALPDCSSFLTPARFIFAWVRTGRHLMHNEEQSKDLLRSLGSVIRDNVYTNHQFAYVWYDRQFINCFYGCSKSIILPEADSMQPLDPECFPLFAMLFDSIFIFDNEHPEGYARDRFAVDLLLSILKRVNALSQSSDDAATRLAALLCIASVLRHFLWARRVADERGVWFLGGIPESRLDANKNSCYLSRDLLGPRKHMIWLPSLLVPLHDSKCCTKPPEIADHEEHIAASNALTVIMYLLEANPAVRDSVGVPQWLDSFSRAYSPSVKMREYLPSEEFIEVLRTASLEKWLEPDNELSSLPDWQGAHTEFLLSNQGWTIFKALKKLARSVNWKEHHRLHPTANSLPGSSSVPTSLVFAKPTSATKDYRSGSLRPGSFSAPPCLHVVVVSDSKGAAHTSVGPEGEQVGKGEQSMRLVDAQSGQTNEASGTVILEEDRAANGEGAGSVATKLIEAEQNVSGRARGSADERTLEHNCVRD